MKILGIETSCDETAVCIVEADSTSSPQAEGIFENLSFKVLGDALYSQAKTHAEYGGVFPALAKREHARNLPALLEKALKEAGMRTLVELRTSERSSHSYGVPKGTSSPGSKLDEGVSSLIKLTPENTRAIRDAAGAAASHSRPQFNWAEIQTLLVREVGLFESLKKILEAVEKPDIDAISVTAGPGLEPALWVGINFAQALGLAWNIPVIATNHMEGHIISPLLSSENKNIQFPAIALLISGGHTELVLAEKWLEYKVIGQTRDDAVGEAFDKVARLLNLPYPGGPEISKLAEEARSEKLVPKIKLPRPMIKTEDFDFSFSGIKTSVLYALQKIADITPEIKKEFALEFENAVTEVLVEKTRKALEKHEARTLILGGGVVANKHIREAFKKLGEEYGIDILTPNISHSTDNALMIAAAGYLHIFTGAGHTKNIKAQGNLKL